MGDVDPKVAQSFGSELQNALAALKRWEENCSQTQEDYKNTHQTTISEAIKESEAARNTQLSNFPSQKPKPRFDLTQKKPMSQASAKELGMTGGIEEKKKKCDEAIAQIKKTIERLNKARVSGVVTANQMRVGVRSNPKFITTMVETVSRGEMLLVLEKKGDWFKVRSSSGKEGWVAKHDISQALPVEINSNPGTPNTLTPQQREENDRLVGAPMDTVIR